MTKYDVKNYLEKIYNVPVGVIRTRIQFGSNKKRNHLNQKVKQPDYKVAYVQLFMRGKHAPTRPGSPTAPGQAQPASRPSAGTTGGEEGPPPTPEPSMSTCNLTFRVERSNRG
ncbi:hypothetical protein CRENBAI_008565 [Crenichthys baileyi]|uniref:Large ribosomal subunit protein uL23m n=1 Tax=Crenichthys baileyi TaxID=28760 RepID=A0AAV9R4W3_9TELE